MLDTVRSIATPEGIELTLRLAGAAPRAVAWVIDFFLRLVVLFLMFLLLIPLGGLGVGMWFIAWFMLEWLFPAACEVWFQGVTPGKKMMDLQVVNDDGTPPGWTPALTRNLLRAVDFLPMLYGIGLVSMMLNRDSKRLGDLAAGTLVVYRDAPRQTSRIPAVAPVPPEVALALADQRAVLDYAERVGTLTPERADELAAIPTRLTGGAQGAQARTRLLQIANYLIGRKVQS